MCCAFRPPELRIPCISLPKSCVHVACMGACWLLHLDLRSPRPRTIRLGYVGVRSICNEWLRISVTPAAQLTITWVMNVIMSGVADSRLLTTCAPLIRDSHAHACFGRKPRKKRRGGAGHRLSDGAGGPPHARGRGRGAARLAPRDEQQRAERVAEEADDDAPIAEEGAEA